jgi:hypothetical protein
MRTTQAALEEFEANWQVRFSQEEVSLIAVIFGAWLMQKSDLQEKQVVLLTDDNPDLEQSLEQQLRELTLLPLNIKYLSVSTFQKEGAPKEVTLIVTLYHGAAAVFAAAVSCRRDVQRSSAAADLQDARGLSHRFWPHHQRR